MPGIAKQYEKELRSSGVQGKGTGNPSGGKTPNVVRLNSEPSGASAPRRGVGGKK